MPKDPSVNNRCREDSYEQVKPDKQPAKSQ